jgi:DNA helicase-2/ATP-dependent DNA helicase PcrA
LLTATPSPERLLEDLNLSQREAVTATSGPLAILAGAGSGKTRVISRRAAYAIETGAVPADQILLVTFTDKAAGEMVERMASLGHRGVLARTFHAAALAQLRHFWPSRHDGAPVPTILDSKLRLLVPLVGRLPGGYRFTPSKDVADTIEWAKVRRIRPDRWVREGGDRAPIPAELFARVYRDYERAKTETGLLDFEDMLVQTVELLEGDEAAASLVRSRKRWFSVDEYQDTNPLSERLLELWLGESRDLAVVGDPDQTIYTFTGATPEFLLGFAERHPGTHIVTLADNYRSSPQILELANRLITAGGDGGGARGALRATQPDGPPPSIRRFADAEAELRDILAWTRAVAAAGVAPTETAVLVRINAQLPAIEDALTRAAIGFTVRGRRFFDRREVREALRLLKRAQLAETGDELVAAIERLFVEKMGLDDVAADAGREGSERAASLELLIGIAEDLAAADPGAADSAADPAAPGRAAAGRALTIDAVLAEFDSRQVAESAASADGVNLLTYHRAKGLEWDAVYLPALDEGVLPIRQAKEADEVAEERRLLYVGITRARRFLALSSSSRRPSRFLAALDPAKPKAARPAGAGGRAAAGRAAAGRAAAGRVRVLPGAPLLAAATPDERLSEALRRWRRERASEDGVPAYVVFHDTTLVEIADSRPRTLPALRRVRGMGPTKLERYGSEILAVIEGVE